jgi:hypothetical protein
MPNFDEIILLMFNTEEDVVNFIGNVHPSLTQAAITKNHTLGGLKNTNLPPHSSGGWKSGNRGPMWSA